MRLTLATALAIALFNINPAPAWTQASSPDDPPPPETGTPVDGQRTPGGTRPELTGACKQTAKPVTALVPENAKGSTTADYPIFWFYTPYTSEEVDSIEFSLHDRDMTTTLYRTSVQLPKTPGVIGIPLPPDPESSLKVNESYHWYFVINCEPKETFERDIVLDGWVKRVQPNSKFENQSDAIWHDELTSLAKLYLSDSQNAEVKNNWAKLLTSIGLEELAQEPPIEPAILKPISH